MLSTQDATNLVVTNSQICAALHETADLLESQHANPFRIAAYRKAGNMVKDLEEPVRDLLDREGTCGLTKLDGIGRSLAGSLTQMIRTGHLPLLDRLQGDYRVERAFATIPDIGPELAHRIHEQLHVENLFELRAAADNGRLATVPGMGPKRIRAVRESLAARLAQPAQTSEPTDHDASGNVPVDEILDIDREYRRLAAADRLPRVAPKRFNPTASAWLPILHTERDDRHYTALFSNTARAHQRGTTHDWVVIYRDDETAHGRWTVITSEYGLLRGKRIVPGRERECAAYYAHLKSASQHAR